MELYPRIEHRRQGVYRDLNAVHDAFDKYLQYDALDEKPRRASDGCAEAHPQCHAFRYDYIYLESHTLS